MAKGLVIPFSLDPRKWSKGLKVVETSLDDIRQDLGKVEDAGDDAAKGISDAFEKAGRDAKRSMDDLPKKARTVGDDTSTAMQDGVSKGGRGKFSQIGAEFGDEFLESWGEAVRSGDPMQAISETFTQAGMIGAAVGGPIAAGVGMGVALVSGMVNGFIQGQKQKKQEMESAFDGLFSGAIDSARESGKSAAQALIEELATAEAKQELIIKSTGAENISQAMEKVRELAAESGLDWQTVFDAMLGDSKALKEVWSRVNDDAAATQGFYGHGFDEILAGAKLVKDETDDALTNAKTFDVVMGNVKTKAKDTKFPDPPSLTQYKNDAEAAAAAIKSIPTTKHLNLAVAISGSAAARDLVTGGGKRP